MPEAGIGDSARRKQYSETRITLMQGHKDDQIRLLSEKARHNTINLIEQVTQKSPTPLACETGCHFCCYLMATVSAPEALEIAHHLRTISTPSELEDTKKRIKRAYQQTNKLDNVARIQSGIPCPFLTEKGLCAIYSYRPLDCVTYHSLSQQACEEVLKQPDRGHPTISAIRWIGIGVKTGLGQGIVDSNLEQPAFRYELIEAINIALHDPLAMEKYVAGNNIFETAAIVIDQQGQRTYKIKFAPKKIKSEAKKQIAREKRSALKSRKQ
jgi:Fe-S-cluster containining protein